MKYVLGIDQGASKTHVMVMDETGKVRSLAKGKGGCHSCVSMEISMSHIQKAAEEALYASGLTKDDIYCVGAGLTGVDWDFESDLLKEAIKRTLGIERVIVVNDCIVAMRSSVSSEISGVICVGSGTNCAVKNRDELFVYGFYIPDEDQGGMSLGMKTVQAVLDAEVGLERETALKAPVLKFFNVERTEQLLYKKATGQITESDYLRLPILLEETAVKGDFVAIKIWEDYGKRLAQFMTARIKIMGIQNEAIEIVLSGSIFKCKIAQFIDTVKGEILKCVPRATVTSAVYEPIIGAALLGLDEIYQHEIPVTVYENIEKSSEFFNIKR